MNASSSSAPNEPTPATPTGPSALNRPAAEPTPIERAQRFEHFTAGPVFLASILFFTATIALLSGSIHDHDLLHLTRIAAIVAYALVLVDFLIRMVIARRAARAFFTRYWFELVALLLPLLRPFVIIIYLWRLPSFRRSGTTLRVRLLITTFLFMFMFVYLISSTVWLVERNTPGANIVNLDDAIWWGFTTLSTVGYGDFVPITAVGRVLAVGLMVGGIAIVGTTTALVVSVLAEQLNMRKETLTAIVGQDPQVSLDGLSGQKSPDDPLSATGSGDSDSSGDLDGRVSPR